MSYDSPKTTPRFCGNCGQKLIEGATFCAYCGTPVPTIDSTGVISAKPATPYTSMPPTVTDRGVPAYQVSYRPERMVREPPLPFIQHFQGVLISPQLEMPRIAKRPNLKQPFLIVLIVGIIAGFALFLLFSKVDFSSEFIEEFFQTMYMGSSTDLIEGLDKEVFLQTTLMMGAFMSPLGYIINWIVINSFVLWILHAIFSSQIPSHERNYKIMATIAGWSFLPLIFDELIHLLYVVFFSPAITVTNMAEFSALESFGSAEFIFLIISLIFQVWGAILVYFGSKSIDAEGYHATIIAILYVIVPYVISYIISYFFSSFNLLGF
ncbi:MAG: zinc ribbon domain-containing protein [Candidatus Hodarchaeota archaeon]